MRHPVTVSYDERLRVPWWWWLAAAALVGLLGAEFHAGFGWAVAVVTDTVLAVLATAFLLWIGQGRVRIETGSLVAGKAELSLRRVAEVRALNTAQWRHRLGPGADVCAHLYTRPWVQRGVELDVEDGDEPYWLVSSRRPEELATALRQACGALSQHGST